MDRGAAGRGTRSKKGSAAPPVQEEAAAKPASATKGRGSQRKQNTKSSDPAPSLGAGPTKQKAPLLNEGKEPDQAGERVASAGRKASQQRKEVVPQEVESDQPGQRREKKPAWQEWGLDAQAPGRPVGAAAVCKRAASQRAPKGEEAGQAGRRTQPEMKAPAASQGCALKAKEPDPAKADVAVRNKPVSQQAKCAHAEEPAQRFAGNLKEVLKTVITLRQQKVSEAASRVNAVMRILVKAIKEGEACFSAIETLGTGSYYEHLKISNPNEFDIMLKLPVERLDLVPCAGSAGAFYYVKLKRTGRGNLDKFLGNEEQLSTSKIVASLRNIISEEVKKMKEDKVSLERKKPGSPAVTLIIGEADSAISVDIIFALEDRHRSWCDSAKNGPDLQRWLGTKVMKNLRNERRLLVPKNLKNGKCLPDTWRLSFSHIEKAIINNHGNTKTCCERNGKKCCRKDCIKLLKYLLEQLKTRHEKKDKFDKFCSYHVKTTFFHVCAKNYCDDEWSDIEFGTCFMRLLDYFLECLGKTELQHFFIPEFNLFSMDRIERAKCSALAEAIGSEKKNGFPIIFQELN